ncbi:hypothetical protein D3C72_1792270 [compost metagenome]
MLSNIITFLTSQFGTLRKFTRFTCTTQTSKCCLDLILDFLFSRLFLILNRSSLTSIVKTITVLWSRTLSWSTWVLVVTSLSRSTMLLVVVLPWTIVRVVVRTMIPTSVTSLLVPVVGVVAITRPTVLVIMTLTLPRIWVYWTIWIRTLTLTFLIIISSI